MGIHPRWVWLSALAAAVSWSAAAVSAAENNAVHAALNTITSAELGHHVDVLASDAYEGREAGSRGGRAAGDYIVQVLEDNHIQPAGEDGGYFQSFGRGYRNVLGMIPGRDPQAEARVHRDRRTLRPRRLRHRAQQLRPYGVDPQRGGRQRQRHRRCAGNHAGLHSAPRTASPLGVVRVLGRRRERPARLETLGDLSHRTVRRMSCLRFNADMIGRLRGNRVEVFGTRSAPGLRKLVSQDNADFGLQLDFMWHVNADGDHYSFFERNIPFLMLHTGLHDNYHRPSDDAELIERDGMQSVSQLMFRVAHDLAEADEVPAFRAAARYESIATRAQFERSMADAPPRLGVSWGSQASEPGLTITRVTCGVGGRSSGSAHRRPPGSVRRARGD